MKIIQKLKSKVKQLKTEIAVLIIAYKDKRTPIIPKLIIGFTVAYLLSPIDLIPDFIPVLGLLDDFIIVPLLIKLSITLVPAVVMIEAREKQKENLQLPKTKNWYFCNRNYLHLDYLNLFNYSQNQKLLLMSHGDIGGHIFVARAWLSESSNARPGLEDPKVNVRITSALKEIPLPTGRQLIFLKAHSGAKGRAMTAKQLAEKVRYKNYRGINLQYGLLASRIGRKMGIRNASLGLLVEFLRPKLVTNKEWIICDETRVCFCPQESKVVVT